MGIFQESFKCTRYNHYNDNMATVRIRNEDHKRLLKLKRLMAVSLGRDVDMDEVIKRLLDEKFDYLELKNLLKVDEELRKENRELLEKIRKLRQSAIERVNRS